MYKAYDDNGVFKMGTKSECLESVVLWCESEDAEEVYSENELIEIINYFSRSHNSKTEITFSGFTIREVA